VSLTKKSVASLFAFLPDAGERFGDLIAALAQNQR
jgi:hypothetical protein